MRAFTVIFLLVISFVKVDAQLIPERFEAYPVVNKLSAENLNKQLNKYDFSDLLNSKDNSIVYGFIGANYQRLRIKFISITKDSVSSNIYHVYGKSMMKKNIDEFKGTLIISAIFKLKSISMGIDSEYKNKGLKGEYIILGHYQLFENKEQEHSGTFEGKFQSDYYLDRNGKVCYDDINLGDSYTNNQFVGKWTDYKTQISKTCNWGDYRMPYSGNFDGGAGDFSPWTTDARLGWETVNESWLVGSKDKKLMAKGRLAQKIENAKWWE
jgi:hypothetical protein